MPQCQVIYATLTGKLTQSSLIMKKILLFGYAIMLPIILFLGSKTTLAQGDQSYAPALTTTAQGLPQPSLSRKTTTATAQKRVENKPSLEIKVAGIADAAAAKNVIDRLTAGTRYFNEASSVNRIKKSYQEAPNEIKKALAPYGYFNPTIHSNLSNVGNTWVAYYQIDPGPVVILTELDFKVTGEGANDPEFIKLIQTSPLKINEPFSAVKYNTIKDELQDLANERGYFASKFEKNVIYIDTAKQKANIVLHFNTGPRYFFGYMRFSKTPLTNSFLKRYADYKPGDYFVHKKVQDFQQNLYQSNYFSDVVVSAETDEIKSRQVPTDVFLVMDKAKRYSAGIGYGTDTGARGLLSAEYRYLNQYGHHLDLMAKVAQREDNITAVYHIPGLHPATDDLQIGAGYQYERAGDNQGRTGDLWISHTSKYNGWEQTLALDLQYERYILLTIQYPDAAMLIPSADWVRKVTDDELRPTKGYRLEIFFEGAAKPLSTVNFFQAEIEFKSINSFTPNNNLRLILHADIGYTFIQDNNLLPFSLQFFAGGWETVRGYPYKSIGPGQALSVASIELQHRIKGNWFLTAFFDAGNVEQKLFHDMQKGVGMGVLWLSPIGAIEAGLAKPLNTNDTWQLVFSMGPEL